MIADTPELPDLWPADDITYIRTTGVEIERTSRSSHGVGPKEDERLEDETKEKASQLHTHTSRLKRALELSDTPIIPVPYKEGGILPGRGLSSNPAKTHELEDELGTLGWSTVPHYPRSFYPGSSPSGGISPPVPEDMTYQRAFEQSPLQLSTRHTSGSSSYPRRS